MSRLLALLLLAGCAGSQRVVERPPMPITACVKWSRPLPEAEAAGRALFAVVARVEGPGPHMNCDVVVDTEQFGVGWLMSPYMKAAALSRCGRRLGRYRFTYKGDQWQAKLITGLYDYLNDNPSAIKSAAELCDAQPR